MRSSPSDLKPLLLALALVASGCKLSVSGGSEADGAADEEGTDTASDEQGDEPAEVAGAFLTSCGPDAEGDDDSHDGYGCGLYKDGKKFPGDLDDVAVELETKDGKTRLPRLTAATAKSLFHVTFKLKKGGIASFRAARLVATGTLAGVDGDIEFSSRTTSFEFVPDAEAAAGVSGKVAVAATVDAAKSEGAEDDDGLLPEGAKISDDGTEGGTGTDDDVDDDAGDDDGDDGSGDETADTTPPTVALEVTSTPPFDDGFVFLRATFSEPVVDMTLSGTIVTGGPSTLTDLSRPTTTTAVFKLASTYVGTLTIRIAAGAARDGAGNGNLLGDALQVELAAASGGGVTLNGPLPDVGFANVEEYEFGGACTTGNGDVTVEVAAQQTAGPCNDGSWTVTMDLSTLDTGEDEVVSVTQTGGSDSEPLHILYRLSVTSATTAAKWNEYVKLDLVTPCAGVLDRKASSCVHGGERKKLVVPVAYGTCADLEVSDAEDWFEWRCVDSGGSISFQTTALRPGVHLADLVTSSAWKVNSVVLRHEAVVVGETRSEAWWTNPVTQLPDNSDGGGAPTLLDDQSDDVGDVAYQPGTIFTVPASLLTYGYVLGVSGLAVVGLDGARLTAKAGITDGFCAGDGSMTTASCVIKVAGSDYHWIDIDVDGASLLNNSDDSGIAIFGAHHVRLDHATVRGAFTGIFVRNSVAATLTDVVATRNVQNGIMMFNTTLSEYGGHLLYHSRVVDNAYAGLDVSYARDVSVVELVAANNGHQGVFVNTGADRMALSRVVAVSNEQSGIEVGLASDVTVFASTLANNGMKGLHVEAGASQFQNGLLVAMNNSQGGVVVLETAPEIGSVASGLNASVDLELHAEGGSITGPSRFDSRRLSGIGCSLSGVLAQATVNNDCSSTGVDTYTATIMNDFGQSFSGGGNLAIYGPLLFEARGVEFWSVYGRFAVQGLTALEQLQVDSANRCDVGSCTLWSWALNPMSPLRTYNPPFEAGGGTCATYLAGSVTQTTRDQAGFVKSFLANALEFVGDGIGDDDGLCNSGETCFAARMIGAYQEMPETADATVGCSFTDGVVAGVTMRGVP